MKSRFSPFNLVLIVAVMSGAQLFARAQAASPTPSPTPSVSPADDEGQENTRGAFLTSRPKTVEKPKSTTTTAPPPHRSRRRPAVATNSSTSGTTATSGTSVAGTSGANSDPAKKKPVQQKMGLGMTLFMRDANGLAVRVEPTHEFHKGDRVRVLLETNADGHLYIFNTTDDGPPVMIYPDAQLDEAGNYLQAHVPLEIPSSVATEENLRWFRFDEHQGVERLYFVFTREPLAGAPIEDDLIKYCGGDQTNCAWHPSTEMWARLQKELSTSTSFAKTVTEGKAQTGTEHDAATRGIGLARDDPEPSLVMMTAATNKGLLVTSIDLFHR